MNIKHIHVNARRWYDGCNTYHSVMIIVDGEYVATRAFEYGYGNHYITTAGDLLQHLEYIDMGDDHWLPSFCQKNDIKFTDDVCDVARKKHLHNCGKD